MLTVRFPLALLSVLLTVAACDDSTIDELGGESSGSESDTGDMLDDDASDGLASPEVDTLGLRYTVGKRWGRCHAAGWGCDGGSPGVGNACLRPVSNDGLNICAPQTWDPTIADDCSNVPPADFGLDVRLQGSAYCVMDCDTDADCDGFGTKCSPTSHFCAYVTN